jgi:hypothetical protein
MNIASEQTDTIPGYFYATSRALNQVSAALPGTGPAQEKPGAWSYVENRLLNYVFKHEPQTSAMVRCCPTRCR